MAEDGIVGFHYFDYETRNLVIANDAAVEASAGHLVNEVAFEAAFEAIRASGAIQAVQHAAEMKAGRVLDNPNLDHPDHGVTPDFHEAIDHFLFV